MSLKSIYEIIHEEKKLVQEKRVETWKKGKKEAEFM